MKVIPLGTNVVVRRLEADEKTAGGIVLPAVAQNKSREGRVLAVGDGRRLANGSRIPQQIREGDRIVFGGYAGVEVQVDGESMLIMNEDDILAIVT
ncbi:MAG TPA: co-chaperone GroES [Pirellulales bacterium]|jgi:chaperonin GroES|nr:co-chaperone GroES [Pirellulales bacterium]